MLMSYDQLAYCAVTYGRNNSPLGRNAMFCMDRYNCALDDILYSTKIEDVVHFFVSSHVSEIHMSEADLLWEYIMSETKFSNCLTGSCHLMCVRLFNYVSCGE